MLVAAYTAYYIIIIIDMKVAWSAVASVHLSMWPSTNHKLPQLYNKKIEG